MNHCAFLKDLDAGSVLVAGTKDKPSQTFRCLKIPQSYILHFFPVHNPMAK